MDKKIIITQSSNFVVKLIGIFLFLFAIVSIIQGIYSLKVSLSWGRIGINLQVAKDANSILITRIVPGSNAEEAGLKTGDRILQINNQDINKKNVNSIWGDSLAGSRIKLKITREGKPLEFVITRKLVPLIDRVIRLIFFFILPSLMLGYILVGLWGLFKQSSFITKLIALVCFSFGSLTAAINMGTVTSPLVKYLKYYDVKNVIGGISLFLAPALWVFLFINFPQKVKFSRDHKFLTLLAIFSIPFGAVILLLAFPKFLDNFKYTLPIYTVFMFSFIVAGIVILSRGARKEQSVLRKRQFNLMLFGIKYGALSILVGFLVLTVYSIFMTNWADFFGWAAFIIFLVTQLIGLILPFTFLNSFFQNKILETEGALRRRLRFLASSFALFFMYMFVAFKIGNWIIKKFQLTDPSFIVLLVLLISLTFSRINAKILHWLEKRLYPEKNYYKNSLKVMIRKMSEFFEENEILENLSHWISDTMGIHPVLAVTNNKIGQIHIPLKKNSRKSVLTKIKNGSNFFWDEIQDENNDIVDREEKKWAHENGISITIPMVFRGEQIGLLNIGKKKNREDFNADDLEIFNEVAYHTAIAIQNIKLQTEYLEKKRLEKELELAREIQNQLMPRKIPQPEDLQIHGEYRPCLEVGGDYFDIITLSTHRIALAIADVSGKGTGAALLMSNLQASLKMAISMSLPLTEMVAKINNVVYDNSLSTQFITFFICIWDSQSKKFEYINAGHNPPLIIKNSRKIQKLTRTGKGLGIRKDQRYKYKEAKLDIHDLLVLYTDGIEDLCNSNLEHFGLTRMIDAIIEKKDRKPEAIIQSLLNKLYSYAPDPRYCDDISIVVAKRIK